MKKLIINADDFGMSFVFNQSILTLLHDKRVTSTSVLVYRITEQQQEQVQELKRLSKTMNISVGLHLDFKNSSYKKQIQTQFALFTALFGCSPSHLDIHKASHFPDSISVVADFCRQKKLPCRNKGGGISYFQTTSSPAFHGTVDDFTVIANWITTLEDGHPYEILFHPGMYDPACSSLLNKKRELDIAHLLKLHTLLKKYNITLVSYRDFAEG